MKNLYVTAPKRCCNVIVLGQMAVCSLSTRSTKPYEKNVLSSDEDKAGTIGGASIFCPACLAIVEWRLHSASCYLEGSLGLLNGDAVTRTQGFEPLLCRLERRRRQLRGPTGILFASRDACSESIAKLFCVCFMVFAQ